MDFKKILSYSLGPIVTSLLGFVSLPVISWYFPPDVVGKLALYNLLIGFSTLCLTLGLDFSFVREFHAKSDKDKLFNDSAIFSLVLCLFVLFLLSFYSDWFVFELFNITFENSLIFSLISICVFFSVLSRFYSLYLRMEEKALSYSFYLIFLKLFILLGVFLAILFKLEPDFKLLLYINLFSVLMCTSFLILSFHRNIFSLHQFELKESWRMIKYTYPLVFSGLAYWGLTSVDKFFVKEFLGFDSLALYSISVSVGAIGILFQTVFSTIWSPIVFKALNNDENVLNKVNNATCLISDSALVVFCACGLSLWVVMLILPPYYQEAEYIILFSILLPIYYTLSEVTVVGISISKKTHYILYASLLSFAANVILNYHLIPILGIGGAALSTSISFFIFMLLRTEFSCLVWEKISRRRFYMNSVIMLVMSSIYYIFGQQFKCYFYFIFTILILFVFYRNRSFIPKFFLYLKFKKGV